MIICGTWFCVENKKKIKHRSEQQLTCQSLSDDTLFIKEIEDNAQKFCLVWEKKYHMVLEFCNGGTEMLTRIWTILTKTTPIKMASYFEANKPFCSLPWTFNWKHLSLVSFANVCFIFRLFLKLKQLITNKK